MTRQRLFHEADLARAIRVAQAAGLTITRIEIDPAGGITIGCGSPETVKSLQIAVAEARLEEMGARTAARRRAREESKAADLPTKGRPRKQK